MLRQQTPSRYLEPSLFYLISCNAAWLGHIQRKVPSRVSGSFCGSFLLVIVFGDQDLQIVKLFAKRCLLRNTFLELKKKFPD